MKRPETTLRVMLLRRRNRSRGGKQVLSLRCGERERPNDRETTFDTMLCFLSSSILSSLFPLPSSLFPLPSSLSSPILSQQHRQKFDCDSESPDSSRLLKFLSSSLSSFLSPYSLRQSIDSRVISAMPPRRKKQVNKSTPPSSSPASSPSSSSANPQVTSPRIPLPFTLADACANPEQCRRKVNRVVCEYYPLSHRKA